MRKTHADYFCISIAGYPEGHPDNIDVVEGGVAALTPSEARRDRIAMDKETGKEIVDKSSFYVGAPPRRPVASMVQRRKRKKNKGIGDTIEVFTSDTLKGGTKKPKVEGLIKQGSWNLLVAVPPICRQDKS